MKICPCCDLPIERPPRTLREQAARIATTVAAAGAAVWGQSDLLGEPWKHWVTCAALLVAVAVAITIERSQPS